MGEVEEDSLKEEHKRYPLVVTMDTTFIVQKGFRPDARVCHIFANQLIRRLKE